MQIEIFYTNEGDAVAMEQCNTFLRSHKIISIKEEFLSGANPKWYLLVNTFLKAIKFLR